MNGRRVVVAGALASKPGNGGEAWVRASWVKGLARLGFDVWFIEELASPAGAELQRTRAVEWFWTVVRAFGIDERCLLLASHGAKDPASDRLALQVLAQTDLLINISGNLRRPDLLDLPRRRAYLDVDPGFTQIWASDGIDLGLGRHDVHLSVGENIGTSWCPLPTAGVRWLPCRQPVVLDDWPVTEPPAGGAFSTVARWRCAHGPVAWNGTTYGLKHHEFRRFVDVADRSESPLELALDLDAADENDRRLLRTRGWRLQDASQVASSPTAFREYVQESAGEFSVAQGVYVHGRTGWFSDRSTRYLASGRPVVIQDTGLRDELLTGEGLVTFASIDDAVGAIANVRADPSRHARAARRIAETYFDSAIVLPAFIDRAGLG